MLAYNLGLSSCMHAGIDVEAVTAWMLARSKNLIVPAKHYVGTDLQRTYEAKFDVVHHLGCYCVGLGRKCRIQYIRTPSIHWRLGDEVKSQRGNLHVHFMGNESDDEAVCKHRTFRLAKLRVPKTKQSQTSYFAAFVQGIGRCCLLCLACHGVYHASVRAQGKASRG